MKFQNKQLILKAGDKEEVENRADKKILKGET